MANLQILCAPWDFTPRSGGPPGARGAFETTKSILTSLTKPNLETCQGAPQSVKMMILGAPEGQAFKKVDPWMYP